MVGRLLLILLLLSGLCGCAGLQGTAGKRVFKDAEIHEDTTWRGEVVIDGSVKVFKGATLSILPGTDVSFVVRDLDKDGLGDAVLVVEGSLHAEGTRAEPIRFRSAAEEGRPGDWLEIRVDFSKDVRLRFCEITDSAYTLHAHFTKGVVEDCTIRGNIDGCRLGQSNFFIRNCLFEKNEGKGINFRNSTVEVARNIVRGNGSGIFLFENDRRASIHHNNIYDNLENFRLGDFYAGDVSLENNWWGTADALEAAGTVYDSKRDSAIGTVSLKPSPEWVPETGPRDGLFLSEAWSLEVGGFVDASPVADGNILYVAGWDGILRALGADGKELWSRDLGDVLDATPALGGGVVFVQSWARELFALDSSDGSTLWRFEYPDSPADDHRQGAPVLAGDLLLLPAWNGTLYALDAGSGALRWKYESRLPLRAAPAMDGDRLYLAGGSGVLSCLALDGTLLWEVKFEAPLLSTPAVTPRGPVAVSRDGLLLALERDGSQLWRRDLEEGCYYGAPIYRRGSIYLATAGGSFWKLRSADGGTIWRRPGLGPVYSTPLLEGGRLYVGDNEGALHVFGSDSGEPLALFEASGAVQSTPAILEGRLVFGSRDRKIHALDMKDADL